jgi:Uma2 family endonuclease
VSTRTLVTFEQFEKFHDDGMKHELLKGEHIVVPPPKPRHSNVQHKLLHLLWPYVQQHGLGDVRIETGFKLSSDTWVQPDVSFIRAAQLKAADPDRYYEGAPALAVEVVSESNTEAQLDMKIDEYFTHGSEEVWVAYPKTKKIRVHYPDGTSRTFAGCELRSDLFPGWSIAVDSLFDD